MPQSISPLPGTLVSTHDLLILEPTVFALVSNVRAATFLCLHCSGKARLRPS